MLYNRYKIYVVFIRVQKSQTVHEPQVALFIFFLLNGTSGTCRALYQLVYIRTLRCVTLLRLDTQRHS